LAELQQQGVGDPNQVKDGGERYRMDVTDESLGKWVLLPKSRVEACANAALGDLTTASVRTASDENLASRVIQPFPEVALFL
jgi:hypothetical protein